MGVFKQVKRFLPLIGIAIFAYILYEIHVISIFKEITSANIPILLVSFLLVILLAFVQTFKWFWIARKQKINVSFGEAVRINLVSNFYGFITPSKLGTIVRAEYLKKYTHNIGKGISNFVLDKLLDTTSVFFLAIVLSYLITDNLDFVSRGWLTGVFIVILLLSLVFINKKRSKIVLGLFYRKFIPDKIKEKAKMMFDSFYEDMPKKRYLILFFIVNLINWILIYFTTYIIGLSLGINLPFYYYLAILPVSTLISLIPITVNGLGTREAVLISLFGLFDVSPAKVVSMSLLSLLITGILPPLAGGLLSIGKKD